MKTFLITGATGLIGTKLVNRIINLGNKSIILTRDVPKAKRMFPLCEKIISTENYLHLVNDRIDVIINLAGANIGAGRWTKKRKKLIYDSRIDTTGSIIALISRMKSKPEVLVNASGIDYYGNTGSEPVDESSPAGNTFLSKVCRDWEAVAMKAENFGTRVVLIRTGVALSRDSLALRKLVAPFRFFAGGTLGSGKQYFSWIHIEDLLNIYFYVVANREIHHAWNAVSPVPVTMRELAKTIGYVLHRPYFFKVPETVLKLILGETSELVLSGRKVVPAKALDEGFQFRFQIIQEALEDLLLRT